MILHDDKKIFIHIPKCGGYSVFHAWLASRPKYMEQFVGAASHTWKRGMSVEGRRPPKKDKDKGTLIINLHATYDIQTIGITHKLEIHTKDGKVCGNI